jgi:GNAT superfamily N-acetyltransferase
MSLSWATAAVPQPRSAADSLIPDWRRRRRHRRAVAPVVRAARPGDEQLVEAMSADLSVRSLYQRFFTGTSRIPREAVRQLATVDHDRQEAVVALVGGRVVGIAQYVRQRSSTGAELAVLVADPWQGHGIGRLLVTRLGELAAARGITHFSALVLPDNEPARRGLASLWPAVQPAPTGDGHGYELPLDSPVDKHMRREPAAVRLARHDERRAP